MAPAGAQSSNACKRTASASPRRSFRVSPFRALVQAIVYQQLAGAAARPIHGRLVDAMNGEVTPDALLALSDGQLQAVALSAAKVRSLRDLATKVLDDTVVASPRRLARQSDEEVTRRVAHRYRVKSALRGISASASGAWS